LGVRWGTFLHLAPHFKPTLTPPVLSHSLPCPFPAFCSSLPGSQLRDLGSAVSSPTGVWGGAQSKLTLVHMKRKNSRLCGKLNIILARRNCFAGKNFSLKNTHQLRALLLNLAHPESHNDRKRRHCNLSIKLISYLFTAFDFSIGPPTSVILVMKLILVIVLVSF